MDRIPLKPRDILYIGAESWTVKSCGADGVLLSSTVDKRPRRLSHEALLELRATQKLMIPISRVESLSAARERMLSRHLVDCTELQRAAATRSAAYVLEALAIPAGRRTAALPELIARVAKELSDPDPPGERTVRGWIGAYRRGGIMALVPLFGRRGNFEPRLSPIVEELIEEALQEYILLPNPYPFAVAHRNLGALIERYNELNNTADTCPSVRTLQRRYDACDKFKKLTLEEGRRSATTKLRHTRLRENPTRLNAVWEIDHTLAHCHLYDEREMLPLGQPWITSIIDRASRVVVGFHIGFDPPSYISVMLALRHAIAPKDYVLRDYPYLKFPYPACGVPEMLVTDRGSDFTSIHLRMAAYELQIILKTLPAKRPHYKGCIERFFRTLKDQLISGLPGSTRLRSQHVDDWRPIDEARIGYAEFVTLFHLWLIDHYHQWPHAGIAIPPAMKHEELLAREGGAVSRPCPALDQLRRLTRFHLELKPQHYGVKWGGLIWQSERFPAIRSKGNDKLSVQVGIEPMNVSDAEAFDPFSEEWFPLKSAHPDYTRNLSLFQHRVLLEYTKQRVADRLKITAKDMMESRLLAVSMMQEIVRRSKRGGSRIARFANLAPSGMAGPILDIADALQEQENKARRFDPSNDADFPDFSDLADILPATASQTPRTVHTIRDPRREPMQ